MLDELKSANKVVGTKQVKRALNDSRIRKLFVASDADPRITQPLAQRVAEQNVEVIWVPTMKELGAACSIAVGAAVAALLS